MYPVQERAHNHLLSTWQEVVYLYAVEHGVTVYGMNIDQRTDGTRVILKAMRDGAPLIAFFNASTLERALEVVLLWPTSRQDVGVKWQADKYYRESTISVK